jgi:hypothetical protein
VLRGTVDHVIAERRRNPSESADLLSMMMSARDEETGEAMTDEQLRVEVTTFLLAGQETTSLALTWTWYLLSQHPRAQRRLEEEIDVVLNGRPPEYSDLVNLPYLRMVISRSAASLPAGGLRGRLGRRPAGRPATARADRFHPANPVQAAGLLAGSGVRTRAVFAERSGSAARPSLRRRSTNVSETAALIETQLSVATFAQSRIHLHRDTDLWP